MIPPDQALVGLYESIDYLIMMKYDLINGPLKGPLNLREH